MKMTYYKNKKTAEVFAYDDKQLSQVARLIELEALIKESEPKAREASNNLQQAEIELKNAHEKLAETIKNEAEESSILALEANANEAAEKHNKALVEFDIAASQYRSLKDEYDAIPLGFFDIRENINVTQKMTAKEVDAHINPPKSKEQYIAEAEQKKQSLLAEANIAIAPLQDAVDLEMATDEEIALLKEWKKYRVLLNRVDTSLAPDIEWPQQPH
ncbi:tail fiber assembly protein [Providencia alcalifaciens]|uniref:tail fiber assembly protein n=1 Tax=Providencia alcalifaciens TaxID=126385 RepID=UPI00044F7B7B|nr:tail fiber assembly protein [Providencia alcalifaciens]EUD07858.1 tail fiber assembly protein [Providencia alcalifaciens R90-1475]